MAGITVCT
jgi:hypothetical protein